MCVCEGGETKEGGVGDRKGEDGTEMDISVKESGY